MTHLSDDTLLLIAYGELETDAHLEACAGCRARFAAIERARVATDWALAERPRRRASIAPGLWALAAAAVLAVVLLSGPPPITPPLSLALPRYVAPELAPIDSLLTRLEQEKPYAIP